MNLHHLKTFYLAAKYLSVSQAARELNIAQPAATRHLKDLQRETGIILFSSQGRKISLTGEGRIFFERAKKIFDEESLLENTIEEIKRLGKGIISISAQATFGDYFLPGVIEELYRNYPGISLSVSTFKENGEIFSLIKKMEYDLGISSAEPESHILKSRRLCRLHQSLIVPPGHRLSGEKMITPDMLNGESFILPEKSTASRKLIDNYFNAYSVKGNALYELGHAGPIIDVVKKRIGISIAYNKICGEEEKNGNIISIPLEDPDDLLSRDFFVIYNKEKQITQLMGKFIDIIERTVLNLA